MSDVITGIGAILKVASALNPQVFTTVGRVITMSGPQLTAERSEITTLDSAGGYKEYTTGLKDGGELNVEVYWVSSEDAQEFIRDAVESGELFPVQIEWPDSPQTIASFTCAVSSVSFNTTANEGVKASFVLKVSGFLNWAAFYGGHNAVTFDGTNDYMVKSAATNTLPTAGYFTFAAKLRYVSGTTFRMLHALDGVGGSVQFHLNTAGVVMSFTNGSTIGNGSTTFGAPVGETPQAGKWFTIHGAASKDGTGTVRVWMNGIECTPVTAWSIGVGDATLGAMTTWAIGSTTTGGTKFNGDIAFVWAAAGATAAYYITNPQMFYNVNAAVVKDVDLGVGGVNPGVTPQIFYGGLQEADELNGNTAQGWNDDYNQGTGGNFTMTGDDVVDTV